MSANRVQITHLETNVTVACQRRCDNCNHFVPMLADQAKTSMITQHQLATDLTNFVRIAHTEAWAAIGGEPLLHPGLKGLLVVARNILDDDTTIEVWTNGQRLKGNGGYGMMPSDFYTWEIDKLVVSAYPGVLEDGDLEAIASCCRDHGIECAIKDERRYPNFTKLLVARDDSPDGVKATQRRYDQCWFKTYSRVLDGGYFYRCCTSPFIPKLLQGGTPGTDGLLIDERTTSTHLQQFLDQKGYMASCRSCAGRNTEEAVGVPWGETRDAQGWRETSGGGW